MTGATIPSAVVPRVAALVRLLGSDQDAEALGAARALQRTLVSAGLDLNTLASVIADPVEPILIRQGCTSSSTLKRTTSDRCRTAEKLTRAATDPHSPLTQWERDFVTSVAPVLRGDAPLTGKQAAMVDRVLSKARKRRS